MSKFHLSDKGPAPCKATIKCPIGGDHFDSIEEAQAGYEKEMKHRTFGTVKKINHDVQINGKSLKVLSSYEDNLSKLALQDHSNLSPEEAAGINSAYDHASSSFDATVQTFEKKSVNLSSLDDYKNMLQSKVNENNEKIKSGGLDEAEAITLKSENRTLGSLMNDVPKLREDAISAETERLNKMPEVLGKGVLDSAPELGARYSTDDGRIYEIEYMSNDRGATLHEVLPGGGVGGDKIFVDAMSGNSNNFKRVDDSADTPYKYYEMNDNDVEEIKKFDGEMAGGQRLETEALKRLAEAKTEKHMFKDRRIKKAEEEYREIKQANDDMQRDRGAFLQGIASKYSSGGIANPAITINDGGEYKLTVRYQ